MRIDYEIKLDYKDVLFRPKRSTLFSRKDVDLNRTFQFKNSKRSWTGVPIIASNMDTVGTIPMAKELQKEKILTCLHKFYTADDIVKIMNEDFFENCIISSGVTENDEKELSRTIVACGGRINFICFDVANGYSEVFINFIKKIQGKFPDITLIAGNVVTGEMVEELILTGVDIIKIGIGSGSVCTTRIQTGVGYPQLSAVIECADAAHGLGGQIIADGGCTIPGDVSKAFGGGADFVMLGGMLAGHDESGGELITKNEKKFMKFQGMSSSEAQGKHQGGLKDYRSSEGKSVEVTYRGPVENTVKNILGGVRSTCTYIGAAKIKNMSKCTTFLRVSQQSNEVYGKNN